jgi:hypothetical protein
VARKAAALETPATAHLAGDFEAGEAFVGDRDETRALAHLAATAGAI